MRFDLGNKGKNHSNFVTEISQLKQRFLELDKLIKDGFSLRDILNPKILNTIFDSDNVGVLIANKDSILLYINSAASALIDYKYEELSKQKLWDVLGISNEKDGVEFWKKLISQKNKIGKLKISRKDILVLNVDYELTINNNIDLYQLLIYDIDSEVNEVHKNYRGESLYLDIIQNIDDAIIVIDYDWRLICFNEAAKRIVKRPLDKILNKKITKIYPEIMKHELFDKFKYYLENRKGSIEEIKLKTPQGTYQWFSVNIKPTYRGVFVHIRDITERKNSSEMLKYFRSIFNLTSECIFVIKPENMHFINVNEAACKILGYDYNDFLKIGPEDIDVNFDKTNINYKVDEFRENKEPRIFETIYKSIDGVIVPVEVTTQMVDSDVSSVVVVTVKDISDRMIAELSIKESEMKFRSIFEQYIDGFILTNEYGRIVKWNMGMQEITGLKRSEAIGKFVWDILFQLQPENFKSPEAFRVLKRKFIKLFKTGSAEWLNKHHTLEIQTYDGLLKVIESTPFQVMSETGMLLGAISRDITHYKTTEKQAIETDMKLKETLRRLSEINEKTIQHERLAVIGKLAAGITHDFSNLLQGIMGSAEIVLFDKSIKQSSRDRLKVILDQSEKAAKLIRQLLDFSRKITSEKAQLNLVLFTKELGKFLVRTIPENVNVILNYDSDEYWVLADPVQLQQVILNLSANAKDAMLDGGRLTISLSRITLHENDTPPFEGLEPGNWIRTNISDTGASIPEEDLKLVFKPANIEKGEFKTVGLGLSHVYEIIKQHQGFIDVQSELGKGTTISIFLPEIVSELEEETQDTFQEIRGNGETILVVDDEPTILDITTSMLHEMGYKTITATNGKQALEIYNSQEDEIDIILTDMVMPEMDGLQLCKELSNNHSDVKILVMTGYPLEMKNEELLNIGIIDFMHKPLSFEQLAKSIQNGLSSR